LRGAGDVGVAPSPAFAASAAAVVAALRLAKKVGPNAFAFILEFAVAIALGFDLKDPESLG